MESKRIKDQQITASSAFNDDFATYGSQRARLNLTSWPPGYRANPTELSFTWIKVDLGTDKVITGLATQGYGDTSVTEWVTSYIAMYESRMGDMQQFTNMQGGPKVSIFTNKSLLVEPFSKFVQKEICKEGFEFCIT